MKALAVRDKDRVTLDNVFELANKKDGKNKGMRKLDDLEDENKDEKQIDDKQEEDGEGEESGEEEGE